MDSSEKLGNDQNRESPITAIENSDKEEPMGLSSMPRSWSSSISNLS